MCYKERRIQPDIKILFPAVVCEEAIGVGIYTGLVSEWYFWKHAFMYEYAAKADTMYFM